MVRLRSPISLPTIDGPVRRRAGADRPDPGITGRRQGGFTLIELLVVVSILSLLVAILLPSLAGARRNTRRTLCACQLREVGRGLELYAESQQGKYPTAESFQGKPGAANWWENAVFLEVLGQRPMPQGRSILTCPEDRTPNLCADGSPKDCWASYAANTSSFGVWRGRSKRGRKRSQIQFPAQAMAFCDALGYPQAPHVAGWQPCTSGNFSFRHSERCTVVYVDTHVGWVRAEEVPLQGDFLWKRPFWGNLPVFDQP